MKKLFSTFLLLLIMLLVVAQFCGETQPPPPPKPSLNVQMVQINNYLNFNFNNGLALVGNTPIDLSNLNWSWLKTSTANTDIKEGSEFVVRFYLDYPLGQPTYDNVKLEIIASSKKVPQLGIITSGYPFTGTKKGTARGEEVNIYTYSFGQLREGTQQAIILGGKVGTIGLSKEDTAIVIVRLLKEDGTVIVGGEVYIKIGT